MAGFGGSMPIYSGSRYQVGGGVVSNIAKAAMPAVKSFAKNALKHGASSAARHLPSMFADLAENKMGMKKALLKAGRAVGKDTGQASLRQIIPLYRKVVKRKK